MSRVRLWPFKYKKKFHSNLKYFSVYAEFCQRIQGQVFSFPSCATGGRPRCFQFTFWGDFVLAVVMTAFSLLRVTLKLLPLTLTWLFWLARCSGVALWLVRALTLAPWRMSRAASAECPCSAATWSGANPSTLQLLTPSVPTCVTESCSRHRHTHVIY